MAFLHYPCGCKFQITNPSYTEDIYAKDYLNQNIPITYDIYNLLDCKKTWELFAEGNTRGVFQLEKGLGKSWSKKMKPECLDDLSALIALLRPACLNSFTGDPPKNLAGHYVDRKNRLEDITYPIEALKPLLESTYGIMTYQEQIIAICRDIAGFTESEADTARRMVGKKLTSLLAELESKFIEGCLKIGKVTEEQSREIFGWISSAARYGFNKSITDDTIVELLAGKYTTINKIKAGDIILAPDGYCQVLGKYNHGKQRIFRVNLYTGESIKCTIHHKFLCENDVIYPLWAILINDLSIKTKNGISRIDNIEDLGIQQVWDIEVYNKQHIFYGNHIATSNSHAICYSYNSYITAYLKTHFPVQFYCAYIDGAREKQKPHEEIRELVLDAKNNNIMVCVPNLMDLTEHTYITGNDIYLGLSSIKGMGDKAILKLKDVLQNNGLPTTWIQFIINIFPFITKTITEGLIKSGALDKLKTPRTKMLFDIEICDKLTNKELEWLQINKDILELTRLNSLDKLIIKMIEEKAYKTPKRKSFLEDSLRTLNNPPYKLVDTIDFIYKSETELLGVPITCHKADYSTSNVNCKDLNNMRDGNYLIAGEIKCNDYVVKRGKMAGETMMIISVVDSSGQVDNISVFPGVLLKYKDILYDTNIVMIQINKWNSRLSAKKIIQI